MAALFHHPQIPDSLAAPQPEESFSPQDIQQDQESDLNDSAFLNFPEIPLDALRQQAAALTFVPRMETGTPVPIVVTRPENITGWNSNRNFFTDNGLTGVVSGSGNSKPQALTSTVTGSPRPENIDIRPRTLNTQDWLLGIFLLLTLLFIWIRVFYGKFFAILGNSLISFQISAKLFREKNILHQRVSFVLDFVYILVFSVFIYEVAVHFGLASQEISPFNLFLVFLNVMIFYTLARMTLLRLTGFLFMAQPVFSEYIHNTSVINKGMGIALFPVVIMAHYLPYGIISLVLIMGLILFAVAFIFKGIRGYQIIIRKDVLIFYLILYLCTLEILPLLLGYKFVTSLI